jgi:hypothetical protein
VDAESAIARRRGIETASILDCFATLPAWHRNGRNDDGKMRAAREPMTIAQLKQSMDRRFQAVDRRFARLERKKADKSDVRRLELKMDRRFRELRQEFQRQLRQEIARSAAETRRHFDVVAEGLHDDLRIFADGIARHTERLDHHEVRIVRLERRAL